MLTLVQNKMAIRALSLSQANVPEKMFGTSLIAFGDELPCVPAQFAETMRSVSAFRLTSASSLIRKRCFRDPIASSKIALRPKRPHVVEVE